MKTQFVLILALTALVLAVGSCTKLCPQGEKKFAIILQSDSDRHEGLARALHALLYAKELKEQGKEVVLIFDGAGTNWAEKLQDSKHKLHPVFNGLKKSGVIQIVCDFCSGSFKVKDKIKDPQLTLTAEYEGHPSILKWVNQGYQIIVL